MTSSLFAFIAFVYVAVCGLAYRWRGGGPDLGRFPGLVVVALLFAGPLFFVAPGAAIAGVVATAIMLAFGHGGGLNPAVIGAPDPWMGWPARHLLWRRGAPRVADPLVYSGLYMALGGAIKMAPLALCAMWAAWPAWPMAGLALLWGAAKGLSYAVGARIWPDRLPLREVIYGALAGAVSLLMLLA